MRYHVPRMNGVICILATILAIHVVPLRAADRADSIVLENRTYTPLWYRIKNRQSRFSEWRSVLPSERVRYSRSARLTAEVMVEGEAKTYALSRGGTYIQTRVDPRGRAYFGTAQNSGRRWIAPVPPERSDFQYVSYRNKFQPLEAFIQRCDTDGKTYKLSLKELARDCSLAQRAGQVPQELRNLYGFTWFFGYLIDQTNQDVILLGTKDATRPPLDVDCLATAIEAVYTGSVPACSLDSHPDPKLQKSVVRGVPWNTRWADVMITADYDMKKLFQGHWDPGIEGFKSHFQLTIDHAISTPWTGPSNSSNRFWFNFDSRPTRAVASQDGILTILHTNPVQISTELEVGGKYGTGATEYEAVQFTRLFNANIETLGKHYPSIGELLALYRIYDLIQHVRQLGQVRVPQLEFWVKEFHHPYPGPPKAVPTLTRKKVTHYHRNGVGYNFTLEVKGGVDMRLALEPPSVERGTLSRELRAMIVLPAAR